MKADRFNQLNEPYGCQQSRSFIDLGPLSDSTFSNFFCSETARLIEAKFHMERPRSVRNENLSKCSRSHDHAHIHCMVKNFKKSSSLEPRGR